MTETISSKEKWLFPMILLLPGFISLGLARYISEMGEMGEFEVTEYSLAISLLTFTVATLILNIPRWMKRETTKVLPDLSVPFVILILTVSIGLGLGLAHFYENDTLFWLLRKAPIIRTVTKRSHDRPLTFLLALNRKGQLEEGRPKHMKVSRAWVEVQLVTGEVYSGYPEYFPVGSDSSEIFLSPACKATETRGGSSHVTPLQGPGVLIYERHIKFIEFIDEAKSACQQFWPGHP